MATVLFPLLPTTVTTTLPDNIDKRHFPDKSVYPPDHPLHKFQCQYPLHISQNRNFGHPSNTATKSYSLTINGFATVHNPHFWFSAFSLDNTDTYPSCEHNYFPPHRRPPHVAHPTST